MAKKKITKEVGKAELSGFDDSKVTPFPKTPSHVATEKDVKDFEKRMDDISKENEEILNDENPLNELSINEMNKLMKQMREMILMMEETWKVSKSDFKLTDNHMKELYQYNEQHCKQMPDNLTDEEKENWDHFNGLDNISEDEVIEIFGEGHPIIGVMHSQTKDRIKTVTEDYFNWLAALREYNLTNVAYMQLVETEESKEMEKLKIIMENETDPEKKESMKNSLDKYYSNKYLDFLAEELSEKDIDMLVKTYGDKKKIEYWLIRTREKLVQMKINSKIILEISQFEKRFLPEKYHPVSNMILLRFMQFTTYAKAADKNDEDRIKSLSMVIALDNIIRNIFDEESRNRVLNNLMKFLDQILDKVIETYPEVLKNSNDDNEDNEDTDDDKKS